MCFTLRLENVQSARFQIVERGQVILHPRVKQLPFAESEDDTGEQSGVTCDNAPLNLPLTDRAFKITNEVREDFLESVSQRQIHRRDLGSQ